MSGTVLVCWLNFFSQQASRQFDQEGRKKFFTLDMNNILLEWVGRLLNHQQPNLSWSCSPFLSFSHSFSAISPDTPPAFLPLIVSVNASSFLSTLLFIKIYIHPPVNSLPLPFLSFSFILSLSSLSLHHHNSSFCLLFYPSCIQHPWQSSSLSCQYWAAGPGAASYGTFRHLLSHGGVCAVQQRSPPQTSEEAQPQHPGEWGSDTLRAEASKTRHSQNDCLWIFIHSTWTTLTAVPVVFLEYRIPSKTGTNSQTF